MRSVLALGLLILVALGALEFGVRASGAGRRPAHGFPPNHPVLRLLHRNNCRTLGSPEAAYFVETCTNGLGLRDREHRGDDSPRLLVLGDASTFGFGVEQSDTFTVHLERALRLGLPSRRPGVFNAGLENTSQVHQDALLRYVYERVRPDVVVLAFGEDDDIDENVMNNPQLGAYPIVGELAPESMAAHRQALLSAVPSDDFLFRHSAVIRLYRQRAFLTKERDLLREQLEHHGLLHASRSQRTAGEAKRRFVQAFGDRHDGDWALTELALDRIRSFVDERRARFLLLRIPSRPSIDDTAWAVSRKRFCGSDDRSSQEQCGALSRDHTARRLAAYASAHGISYVDPGGDLSLSLQRGESVYLPEGRLGRLGHARVGEVVARAVLPELGGKPAEPAAKNREPRKERKVGAYWYPWYRTRDWSAFTDYVPVGGTYLSADKAVVFRQLHGAERAELDFFVIELVAGHNADSQFNNRAIDTLLSALEERRRRGHTRLQFAMLSDISVAETSIATSERWLATTRRHLDEIWTRYVEPNRDAYLHIDGKPLVAIFSPPVAIDDARFTVIRPYWVSHEQWKDWNRKNEVLPFWDTYPQTLTDRRFLSVVPGYNDWRLERRPQVAPYLSRLGGRTFVEQWRRAFEVAPDIVLVYSYNEYFEQTQIEPTAEYGDRYLLLNQLLARRFKEGRSFDDSELLRLAEVIEPRAKPDEEKATWLPIDDPRITSRGLHPLAKGRAELRDSAELELPVEGEASVVFGLTHAPSFEPCAWLSATFANEEPSNVQFFPSELTQLSVLRDVSIPVKGRKSVKLHVRRVRGRNCRDSGTRPVVLTGVTRYPVPSQGRRTYRLWYPTVDLEGFHDIETHPTGYHFSWSRGRSKVTISKLTPGARYRITLTFFETAGYEHVDVGLDPAKLQRVAITPARTATLPEAATVSRAGTIAVSMETPTWLPSKRFGAKDKRVLGIALRLVTLDRMDESPPP